MAWSMPVWCIKGTRYALWLMYRPALIGGFLAQTGLTLESQDRKEVQMLAIQPL